MKVVAEHCRFMLHLTKWICRLPARDSPASSPSLMIVGQVCGKQTNLNRNSTLDLIIKQTCNLLLAIPNAGRSSFTNKVWDVERKDGSLMVTTWMYELNSTNSTYQHISAHISPHSLLYITCWRWEVQLSGGVRLHRIFIGICFSDFLDFMKKIPSWSYKIFAEGL